MKVHWTMERSPVVTSRIKLYRSFLTLCSPHIAGEGELRGFKRESEPREREYYIPWTEVVRKMKRRSETARDRWLLSMLRNSLALFSSCTQQ